MRSLFVPLLAAGAVLLPVTAFAQSTTRIETRPFYGATVTLEEGVRVFRPLPSHDRVIINPGGVTPLNLTLEERRSVSHNYVHGQGGGSGYGAPVVVNGGVVGGPYAYGPHRGGHKPHGASRGMHGSHR